MRLALPLAIACLLATLAHADWPVADEPDLAARLDAAEPVVAENLGAAVRSVRVGESMLVPNPDGETWDVLQWYFKDYGGPTVCHIIDLSDGSVRLYELPMRQQIHICGRQQAPDGKFYIATPNWNEGMVLRMYDPATNAVEDRGVIVPMLTGEKRPMVMGTDGMIYGAGSYLDDGTVGAYQLDWRTGEITDYGRLGPSHKPNSSWGYYLGADDTHVYVSSGKVPWYLIAVDKATGEHEVLLETSPVDGIISIRQLHDGVTARASKPLGREGETVDYWLHRGAAIEKTGDTPPWPARPAPANPWPPKPELYTENLDPDLTGHAALWYRTPAAKAAAADLPEDAPAADRGWRKVDLQVDIYPQKIRRLAEMPDGRLIGTADFYLGNFLVHPDTGVMEHVGKSHLSHYATAMTEDLVYMCGYPSSPLYVYDPDQPWTAGKGTLASPGPPETDPASNPRLLTRLNQWARTHKMYGGAVGADGRVYFGGRLYRNGNGGGLAWWDPVAEEAGGVWEPFSAYQIHWVVPVNGGTQLVLSTAAVRDDLDPDFTPDQARLFVWDVAAGEIVREIEPVPGAPRTGGIVEVAPGRLLGATADPDVEGGGVLYGVDIDAGQVLFTKKVPRDFSLNTSVNRHGNNDFRIGPSGRVWTYLGDRLVRIDPADATVEVIGSVSPPGRIAFSGADLYLGGTTDVRVIRNIVARQP